MRSASLILSLGLHAILATAAAVPRNLHRSIPSNSAIYFLRVDPSGSSVVAISIGSDGQLVNETSVTATNGLGLQSLNASANDAAVLADPLQGQNALTVGDEYLFAVNSKSDTVTMFSIDPEDPLNLTIVGTPAATLGSFPMSVAYSDTYQKLCVLNGGRVNGVTCYSVSDTDGLVADGEGLREFHFEATTPPVLGGDKASGSDIQFTPDGSRLIVTFKGAVKPAGPGRVRIFDVSDDGAVATTATKINFPDYTGLFGFAMNKEAGKVFIAEVDFGAVLFDFNATDNSLSQIDVVNQTSDAVASCWAAYSHDLDRFYNIDAGAPMIGVTDAKTTSTEFFTYSSSLAGGFDTVVHGSTAYFLTAVNEVGVLDLAKMEVSQTFEYSTADDRPYWTGMAKYIGSGWSM